jgi:hypothetical protein
MKIAILSWGSLIKTGKSRNLAIADGFTPGGPMLPIEFSRVSQSGERKGCLTLVIDEENGVRVPTQYAISIHNHLDWALANLRFVENITLKYSVGYVNLVSGTERGWARENHPLSCDVIKQWARENRFDAVIWTALLPNFERVFDVPFTVDGAVNYINNLTEPVKSKAMEYIKNAPTEIITPVRSRISGTIVINNDDNNNSPNHISSGEESLMRFLERFRCESRH